MKHLSEFYKAINYTPRNEELFLTAVTHSSYGKKEDNERMEFLGDAVLARRKKQLIKTKTKKLKKLYNYGRY